MVWSALENKGELEKLDVERNKTSGQKNAREDDERR